MLKCAFTAAVIGALATAARAEVETIALGAGPPPAVLAGLNLTSAPLDRSPLFTAVEQLVLAPSLSAQLSSAVTLRRIGAGWDQWGHGYQGDVYTTDGARTISITPPPGVAAMVIYIDAVPFSRVHVSGGIEDGPGVTQIVSDGSGPVGFAFLSAGGSLPTIELDCDGEFAFGQVMTSIPAPGAIALAFSAVVVGLARRGREARSPGR